MRNIMSKMDQTKNVISENLEKLLERGEKLEILEEKTQYMQSISTKIH